MNKKEKILELYFEQNKKQKEIAKELEISQSYVSQVVKSDDRLQSKKEASSSLSKEKKKAYNKEYWKNYQRKQSNDPLEYEKLQAQLKQDSKELSYSSELSDYAFVKWNSSMYHRSKNGNLVLNKGINVGADVPKSVNMNIKVPTQKYKHNYVR